MVHKETCPKCKGNRIILVTRETDKLVPVKCPSCGGQGYKIRMSR